MKLIQAIQDRHSVRCYLNRELGREAEQELRLAIAQYNGEGTLHNQLMANEPHAFSGFLARYGKFENVRNYIALAGKQRDGLEEACGYYGEKLVLLCQQLGLNTCWVGGTYRKGSCPVELEPEEQLVLVIALGYGEGSGRPHKTKPLEALCRTEGEMPEWFLRGMEAVQMAPTAFNQQRFFFALKGNMVQARALPGFYARVDLGIAKCHFEIGGGADDWRWREKSK